MSRDWNIVDDEPDEMPSPGSAQEDDRLNLNRVRLVATERGAETRQRQWAFGAAVLAMLAAIALAERGIAWRATKPHAALAACAIAVLVAFAGARIAMKLGRRKP